MDQHAANWDHCLEHAAASDVGLRRANNQDHLAVVVAGSQEAWQNRGHLFIVADGMGAHAAGELASKLAVDTVALTYSKRLDLPPAEAILAATEDANQQIHGRGQADPEFKGMGTTSTALALLPEGALLAHVGDSRAYRLRGDRYEQLTFDHSLVWEMRAAGQLAGQELPDYIPKNIITRSLGPSAQVEVDLEGPFPIAVGDTFLLCSDGLSGPVKDEEMGVILGSMPPSEAVRALIDLANLRGGPDNVTVIVARVTGPQVARDKGPRSNASSGSASKRPVHPAIWALLGGFSLATVGLAAVNSWPAALICLVGAIAAAATALAQRYGAAEPESRANQGPLGKGPYSAVTCPPNDEFVERFARIVQELCDAAIREDWTVDWPRFNALREQAAAARQAGDLSQAVRSYLLAISFMMGQLKQQRPSGNEGGPLGV